MPNTYFQFKQFTVHQEKSPLKVCTDACIQGAWSEVPVLAGQVLDIGTGTGLLSLMLAQRFPQSVTGVELQQDAWEQATDNFAASPWAARLEAVNSDILAFEPGCTYDYIITNPPFFGNDLKSDNTGRNHAMHDTALTLPQLAAALDRLLSANGVFSILLPEHRMAEWEQLCKAHSFYLQRQLLVRQSVQHGIFRVVSEWGRAQKNDAVTEELSIRDSHNQYSAAFTELLKPYYLYL
jgi:tRNA1Val (adenine37-N6)-methyltransferase